MIVTQLLITTGPVNNLQQKVSQKNRAETKQASKSPSSIKYIQTPSETLTPHLSGVSPDSRARAAHGGKPGELLSGALQRARVESRPHHEAKLKSSECMFPDSGAEVLTCLSTPSNCLFENFESSTYLGVQVLLYDLCQIITRQWRSLDRKIINADVTLKRD